MSPTEHRLRFTFQTKVLVPVLTVLVLLPTITLWVVHRSMVSQMEIEAHQTLVTAETVFQQLLELRARDLLLRFRNAVNESSYRSLTQIVAQNDPVSRETVRQFLNDRLQTYGDDCEALLLVSGAAGEPVVARRGSPFSSEEFIRSAAQIAAQALQGEAARGAIDLRGRAYLVVSVPVTAPETGALFGTLTVASRIGDNALKEFKSIVGPDIFLLSDQAVTAATVRQPDQADANLIESVSRAARILPVVIGGEHSYALPGEYRIGSVQAGFRYVLLSSYEPQLRELDRTFTTLVAVSLAGILVSGLVVWFFLRRITHPLEELRDNAEAVGRGDFTRRIARFSNDECGSVAVAFNTMTENLQASRADLEKAVGSLKTTQAQLIQSEKLSAVGQFVAGIAHELNNPLTSVIGFADLLLHTDLDAKYKSYVDRIANSATRCHKIVNSLLGFSRQHEPERKPVAVNELADAVVEIVAYDLRSSNIAVAKEYQSGLPLILGDAHQLQQVILNIISNARQATEAYRQDGKIVLRTGCTDTHVWLRIRDNGPGITKENLSRIFDPFFTTKPQGKGTGLGLSLSYGIMQEHNGRIHAESQPGEGTEFVLELPIAKDGPAQPAPRLASAPPMRPAAQCLKVLVIDDEESILHLIQEVLRSEGHQVEAASGGQAALDLIRQHQYDVIVSDWKMPGLNGINLYQELLEKNPKAASRVLFMTGDVVKEDFQEFLRKNSRYCLPKPFALREFHSAIAKIVSAG